jgi:membrane protease YdiL (CAAX protease family)
VIEVVSALLFVLIVVGIPIRGRLRYERFRREVGQDPGARLRYYRSSLPWKYGLAAVVVAVFFLSGRDASGLRLVDTDTNATASMLGLGFSLLLGALLVRVRLGRPKSRAKLAKQLRGIADLLPRTGLERRRWVHVAINAGVTEELLYRGFVFCVLARVFPGVDTFSPIAVSALFFGLAHAYQGKRGIVLTTLVGAVLGSIAVHTGLLVAMLVHALIDLRILAIPADLMEESSSTRAPGVG